MPQLRALPDVRALSELLHAVAALAGLPAAVGVPDDYYVLDDIERSLVASDDAGVQLMTTMLDGRELRIIAWCLLHDQPNDVCSAVSELTSLNPEYCEVTDALVAIPALAGEVT